MMTTPMRVSPISRRSQLAGKVASTHTPTGVPTSAPLRSATRCENTMSRRNWMDMTRAKAALYTETSGTAMVRGIRKGSRDNATNPRPKPASPNTKLASARMPAPATHATLTRYPSPTRAHAGRRRTTAPRGRQGSCVATSPGSAPRLSVTLPSGTYGHGLPGGESAAHSFYTPQRRCQGGVRPHRHGPALWPHDLRRHEPSP